MTFCVGWMSLFRSGDAITLAQVTFLIVTVSKLSNESMAFCLALLSFVFMSRRNFVLHSVMIIVAAVKI